MGLNRVSGSRGSPHKGNTNRSTLKARSRVTTTGCLLIFASLFAVLFLAVPQIVLMIRGMQTRGWEGVSTASVAQALGLSLFTTFFASLLTIIFGTPLAYCLARFRFFGRRLLFVVIELPIVLPPTVAGLALLITLGRRGVFGDALGTLGISLPFTTGAVILAQVFISAPFFIRAAHVGFSAIPKDIEEAARVDGAAGFELFWQITLPLSITALGAGLSLSWARALGEFGATILFAGSIAGIIGKGTRTLPLLIYNLWESDIDSAIWASLILLALAFFTLLASQWLTRRMEQLQSEW